jgi:hypothetical protein
MNLQLKLSGWLTLLIRAIAAIGLLYEIVIDHLRNPTALVVFGGLGGLPDVLGYRMAVKREVEREVERERDEERKP